MPRLNSRVRKWISVEPVKKLAVSLIDALNGEWKGRNPEYNRHQLIFLVRKFQELEAAWLSPGYRDVARQYERPSQAALEAVEEPWFAILKILEGYTAFPVLMEAVDALMAGGELKETWTLRWHRADEKPHMDLEFSLDVIEVFRDGKISSLRECKECAKWLYARFPHQRFCSVECKEQFHTKNEADKSRRREWARANYQTRKELELGSRKAAQRKGGKR